MKYEMMSYEITYDKPKEFFIVMENYVSFIKGCESFIRKTNDYSNYISELKSLGLTHCQVLGNAEDIDVEMHHGPIFTLFDYCSCLTMYLLKEEYPVNTPTVAKIIMNEHWNGNVQTVMLSSTAHQAVDSGKLFINLNQAYGNLGNFLKKYSSGLTDHQIEQINKYIKLSKTHKSTDNGLFDTTGFYDWSVKNEKQ